jgi:hypothetical protein
MQTVSVIGFDGALASAITGVIDLFRLAGVTWARIHDEQPVPRFTTRLLMPGAIARRHTALFRPSGIIQIR